MIVEVGKVWVTVTEISAHLNTDDQQKIRNLIKVRCSQSNGTSWVSRPHITPTSKIVIDLESIPTPTRTKYNIPSKEFFLEQEQKSKQAHRDWIKQEVSAARSGLFNAIAADPLIEGWYLERMKSVKFASHSMWKRVMKDYPLLFALLTEVNHWIDLTGKWSTSSRNLSFVQQYGFEKSERCENPVGEFLDFVCEEINKRKLHNFNISNRRKFIDKLKPITLWLESAAAGNYQEEQSRKTAALESLISKKFGVTNYCKRSEWHINQLVKLARFGNQPKSVTLWNSLNSEALTRGKDEISYETLRLWLNDKSIYNRLRLAYDGHMKWMNNRMFVINTEGASGSDVLWWADGETVELYWWDAKDRQLRRENYCVVMDDFSRKIIGWARGTESHDTTYRAVKRAIEHRGTVAWQFKTDKGPGFKGTIIEDFFDTVFAGGYGHTPATTGLARAKAIEPMFARFREQVLATQFVNHSFGNITSKGSQANPDFIKEHLHEFPTSPEQLDNQWMIAIDFWNSKPHEQGKNAGKTPDELYEYEYDDRKYVSELWMTEKFWLSKPKPSTYEAHGLKITWAKQDYLYLAPVPVRTDSSEEDLQKVASFLNENAGRKFDVKFDPDNLDRVALYFNGTFMCYAFNKIKTKRALFDTTSEDSHILHQYWKIQEMQEEDIKDFYRKNDHYTDAHGLAKAPMMLSNKKQRAQAETDLKTRHMIPDAEERKIIANEKFAGISKW
jgi:Integrase core domain